MKEYLIKYWFFEDDNDKPTHSSFFKGYMGDYTIASIKKFNEEIDDKILQQIHNYCVQAYGLENGYFRYLDIRTHKRYGYTINEIFQFGR